MEEKLGPYEIIAPIGSGGMGRVFRARDTRLGRLVAIKLLPAGETSRDAIARMRREAEAASSLNDAAIVTIYDIGESESSGLFIAMELIEGSNLREWLQSKPSREQKLEVVSQAAKGLSAAHAHGVIHRDIKPENIMITRAGAAKIVDFGLAKPVEVTSGSTDVKITAHGRVAGTLAYMSPEQLAGEPLDARSDIYSFGLVLRDVFGGNDPAVRPVIERCLQRDRLQRYQSMDAVLLELKPKDHRRGAWAAVAAAAIAAIAIAAAMLYRPTAHDLPSGSIAVLPFRALGAQTYLAEGMTDALTTDLARQPGLAVIARNSSKHYASDSDLRAAASDLNARYVLLGSVQPVGSSVRVDARLVDATSGAHVWADHFDRPLSEVLAAESEIVRAVAAKLHPAAAARGIAQPSDPRVADLYLRARYFSDDPAWPVKDRSIPLLEQVVQLDGGFLPARIELAQQYQRKAFEHDPDRLWNQKAFVEIQKILAADPTNADAYTIRGDLHFNIAHAFDADQAIADYNRAVRLDPNNVRALQERGSTIMHFGLLEEALADFNRVLRLDPFNDFVGYRVTRIHLYQQQCQMAATEYARRWPNDFQFPVALECAGRPDEAMAALEHLASLAGSAGDLLSTRAVILAKHGRRAEALDAIRKTIASDHGSSHFHHAMYYIAAAYAQLGDATNALHWLERTSREGLPCYPLFAKDPLLDPIRSDPRIAAFLDASRREWEERRRQYRP